MFSDAHHVGAWPEKDGYLGPFASNLTITVPMLTPPPPDASEYTTLFFGGRKGTSLSGRRGSIIRHHFSSLLRGFLSFFDFPEYCRFAISIVLIFPNRPCHSCCVNPNLPRNVAASALDNVLFLRCDFIRVLIFFFAFFDRTHDFYVFLFYG